jgi:hypothetical protein
MSSSSRVTASGQKAVEVGGHVAVGDRVVGDVAFQRGQRDAAGVARPGRPRRRLLGPGAYGLVEAAARHRLVHQPPPDGRGTAHALGLGGEHVGEVAADAALVDHAGQAAGAGEDRQQRHLRQRHRRGAVVDQDDLVAGQGQLVAAARRGAVDRGDVGLAGARRGVLHAVARLVGELAEVHLPGVAGLGEHPDVGARAEHLLQPVGDHHGADLGVLEAQPLDGVVQLDVDAEVVGVQLEVVAGDQAAVLVGAQHDPRGLAVDLQGEVPVGGGMGVERDPRRPVLPGPARGPRVRPGLPVRRCGEGHGRRLQASGRVFPLTTILDEILSQRQ